MRTYPLTPQQFSALRTRLLELGITLPDGEDGELEFRGIRLKYNYYSKPLGNQRLVLQIIEKPWIVSESLIWGKVDEWLSGLA